MVKFLKAPPHREYGGDLLKIVYEVIVPADKAGYSPYTGEVCLDKMINPVKNGVDVLEKQGQGYKWLGKQVFKVEKTVTKSKQ